MPRRPWSIGGGRGIMTFALELLSDFLENPPRAARLAAERRTWFLGLVCLAVSGASLFLAQAVSRHYLPLPAGPASLVCVCLGSVLGGFVLAGSLHLFADAWGLSGSGTGLFVLIGLSELTWALILPCALVLKAVGLDGWLSVLALVSIAGVLSMRLKARSLRWVYGISAARAWSLLALPYLGMLLAAVAAFTAVAIGTAISLFKLFA